MSSTTAGATEGSIFPVRRWHELYHAAIIELDSTKLLVRIAEARMAILDRAKEILTMPRNEHYSLNDALRSLLLLEAVGEKEERHKSTTDGDTISVQSVTAAK